jgi:hypothetical protein
MDRIEEIKNGSFTAGDVIWLVSEVERLRAERNSAINEATRLHYWLGSIYDSLSKEMHRASLNSDDLYPAGEKALNTLAYARKYFMGSEHGHEV